MPDEKENDPHGLNTMRFEIRETLSALDEGMLKKIHKMLNAPVSFEYRDSRAAEVKVTIEHGWVTWHVKGTAGQVEATLEDLTIMELCESDIGQALHLTVDDVLHGLGWNDFWGTLYGLPPHASDAVHRLTDY